MSQLFQPRANTIARLGLLAALLFVALAVGIALFAERSPYVRGVGVAVEQPVLFSHELHAGQLALDCRYCHTTVEQSSFAGMPDTESCMTCHAEVAAQSPLLDPVRQSWEAESPILWNRVHNLADSVFFDHSIHVQKGVGCESCHGRVDQMPRLWQAESMTMEWCLACHRDPAPRLRPAEAITTMGWEAATLSAAQRAALLDQYHIATEGLTDCSVCHR